MTDKLPRPYYTVEYLGAEGWKVDSDYSLRAAAIGAAKQMARTFERNHHVYLHTRNGQRKHIFKATV